MVPDDLTILIQRLSKAEKRNFKLYSQFFSTEPLYLKLFEKFDQKTRINPERIRKELNISKREFPRQKRLLIKVIQKSLYFFEKSGISEIQFLIFSSKNLFKRGLKRQSRIAIKRAKKIASSHELFYKYQEALEVEKVFYPGKLPSSFVEERVKVESIIANLEKLISLKEKLRYASDDIKTPSPKLSLVDQILGEISQMPGDVFRTKKLRLERLLIIRYCRIVQQDYPLAKQISKEIIELLRDNETLFSDQGKETFIKEINVQLNLCSICHSWEEFEKYLFLLKSYHCENFRIKSIKAQSILISEFTYAFDSGEVNCSKSSLVGLEDQLNELENSIDKYSKLRILFLAGRTSFLMGDFGRAAKLFRKGINLGTPKGSKIDYWGLCKIFLLLVFIEQGDLDSFEYHFPSSVRYFEQNSGPVNYYKELLSFLRNMTTGALTKEELTEFFQEGKQSFQLLIESPNEHFIEKSINILGWLNSKISGKTMLEMTRSKFLQSYSKDQSQQESKRSVS